MKNEKEELIKAYLEELYRWNKKISLTSVEREDAEEVLIKPSVSMMEHFPLTKGLNVFDIGAGGGIPAVVLAIHLPKYHFSLVESVQKKCSFLTHVSLALGLENIVVLNERIEKLAKKEEFKGCADIITSRQIPAETVFNTAQQLLKAGGRVIIHRSPKQTYRFSEFRMVSRGEHADCFERV